MTKSLEERISERWKISAAQTKPENRMQDNCTTAEIRALLDRHREACIQDVEAVLRETIIEFVAGYHLGMARDIPLGRSAPDWPDEAYYFGRSLFNVRATEMMTGIKAIADIRDYYPQISLSSLETLRNPSRARELIDDRRQAREFCQRDMLSLRNVHTAVPNRSAGEIVADATHKVLYTLTQGHSENSTDRPFLLMNAKMMAEYLIQAPQKSGFVEPGLRKNAEGFVDALPHLRNPGLFVSMVSDMAQTLNKKRKKDGDPDTVVTPIRD